MTDTPRQGLGINDIIGDRRAQVIALAARYGASNVRVFGSVARGEAGPDSDLDLLVWFPADTNIFTVVGLWQDLQDLLGCEVDLVVDHASAGRIGQIARREAVPL